MESSMLRRTFLKGGTLAMGAVAAGKLPAAGITASAEQNPPEDHDKATVFFTSDISVNGLLNIYSKINSGITGKTAIKLHTGEPHGPNLLPLELIKGLQAHVPNSTIVECNVLYSSPRQKTASHREVLKTNGFNFCPVDIMDEDGDANLPIKGMREFFDDNVFHPSQPAYTPGWHLTEIAVGKNLLNYDSLLVYTHFKGHTMGGFGGSLKNIAIGCSSGQGGKRQIHGEGWPKGDNFLERMVEAGKGISDHFGEHITYINVLKNISVDCDCDAHGAKPTCRDIGILGSTDILAIDKASVDLVYAQDDKNRHDIIERIESRGGKHQIEYMRTLHMGNDRYNLVTI